MNLFKGNVTAAVFSSAPSMGGKPLRLALRRAAFEPINPKHDHERAAGFVEFERTNETEFQPSATDFGQWVLLQWRVDTLKVPAVKLRKALLEWAQSFEQKNGRAPGRRERAEQKVVAKQVLRAQFEPATKLFPIAANLITGEFIVFGAGASVVDEVQAVWESVVDQRLTPNGLGALHRIREEVSRLPAATDGARGALESLSLGRAFLTWLLWRSESTEPVGEHQGTPRGPVHALFFGKADLRGLGDVATARVTGTTAPYSHLMKTALNRGLLVDSARVRFTVRETEWCVTLDAERLALRSLKLPQTLREQPEDVLVERLESTEEVAVMVLELVQQFARLRTGPEWPAAVDQMLAWMRGEETPAPITTDPDDVERGADGKVTLEGWAQMRSKLREQNGRCARCGEAGHDTSRCTARDAS